MRKKKTSNENSRLNALSIVFVIVSLGFIYKLFTIQVLNHNNYRVLAEQQHWNQQILPAKRGTILSSDGFQLASNQIYYVLYAEPKKIQNKEKLAEALSQIFTTFDIEEKNKKVEQEPLLKAKIDDIEEPDQKLKYYLSFFNSLNQDLFWVSLSRNISPDQKAEIEKLKLEGIGFEEEPVRFYPEGTLVSNVLGFVASDEKGESRGYYGIEGNFDGDLRGKDGRIIEEKDAEGSPILVGGFKKVPPTDGRNSVLTINRSVQYIVEKKLREGVDKYKASSGSIIVMNPLTGEVIAMANYPTFNPSKFYETEEIIDKDIDRKSIEKRNLSISETYEPGSVIKPFTVATAIDLGKINPNTTFNDDGPVKYSDYYIDNWNGKHYGVQTIIELLQKSNNIGAAWVGHQVGVTNLYNYFKKFGMGEKTNIDLEGEDTGIMRPANEWTDIDLANIAFGQGISATPLQVLNAFNSLINGGYLYQPKIVSKIVDNGKEIDMPNKMLRSVISKETSNTMVDLLVQAVEGGESKYYNIKNYKIGGKTGTAQIPFNGKYDPQKTNATFVGFFAGPKNVSMIVRLNKPTTSIYAAETAVPLWMSTAEDLANYYGILPDKKPPQN